MAHEEHAERAERGIEEMKEKTERLGDQIEEAKRDWEQKKSDERVPGTQPEEKDEE